MRELVEYEDIKMIKDFVRGDAINIGGDNYIVQNVNTVLCRTEISMNSLSFPDKDHIIMSVNADAMFVNDTLLNMAI